MKYEEIPSVIFLNNLKMEITQKDGAYDVEVIFDDNIIHFQFSEFEFSARSKECVIKCWQETPSGSGDAFEQRLNILSGSAKSDFVRQLTVCFGKETKWALLFSNVCSKVSEIIEKSKVAKSYSDFDQTPEIDLLTPFLRNQAVNTFFGMGGSGKTFLALEMGLSVAFGIPFLGNQPKTTGNVMFVDYESNHFDFFDRISLLAANKNLDPIDLDKKLFRFDPEGLPFHDLKNILLREIKSKDIKLLIIDSAALACGGEPESASIATRFFNAINTLKVCTLLIAHKSKSEESDKYPFGSIFFYNSSRNVWLVKGDQENEDDLLHTGLIHRKSNNSKLSNAKAIKISFQEGLVTIEEESNQRWGEHLSLKTRILNFLEEGPKSLTQIHTELGVVKERIKPRLSELKNDGKIVNFGDDKWSLFYPEEISA